MGFSKFALFSIMLVLTVRKTSSISNHPDQEQDGGILREEKIIEQSTSVPNVVEVPPVKTFRSPTFKRYETSAERNKPKVIMFILSVLLKRQSPAPKEWLTKINTKGSYKKYKLLHGEDYYKAGITANSNPISRQRNDVQSRENFEKITPRPMSGYKDDPKINTDNASGTSHDDSVIPRHKDTNTVKSNHRDSNESTMTTIANAKEAEKRQLRGKRVEINNYTNLVDKIHCCERQTCDLCSSAKTLLGTGRFDLAAPKLRSKYFKYENNYKRPTILRRKRRSMGSQYGGQLGYVGGVHQGGDQTRYSPSYQDTYSSSKPTAIDSQNEQHSYDNRYQQGLYHQSSRYMDVPRETFDASTQKASFTNRKSGNHLFDYNQPQTRPSVQNLGVSQLRHDGLFMKHRNMQDRETEHVPRYMFGKSSTSQNNERLLSPETRYHADHSSKTIAYNSYKPYSNYLLSEQYAMNNNYVPPNREVKVKGFLSRNSMTYRDQKNNRDRERTENHYKRNFIENINAYDKVNYKPLRQRGFTSHSSFPNQYDERPRISYKQESPYAYDKQYQDRADTPTGFPGQGSGGNRQSYDKRDIFNGAEKLPSNIYSSSEDRTKGIYSSTSNTNSKNLSFSDSHPPQNPRHQILFDGVYLPWGYRFSRLFKHPSKDKQDDQSSVTTGSKEGDYSNEVKGAEGSGKIKEIPASRLKTNAAFNVIKTRGNGHSDESRYVSDFTPQQTYKSSDINNRLGSYNQINTAASGSYLNRNSMLNPPFYEDNFSSQGKNPFNDWLGKGQRGNYAGEHFDMKERFMSNSRHKRATSASKEKQDYTRISAAIKPIKTDRPLEEGRQSDVPRSIFLITPDGGYVGHAVHKPVTLLGPNSDFQLSPTISRKEQHHLGDNLPASVVLKRPYKPFETSRRFTTQSNLAPYPGIYQRRHDQRTGSERRDRDFQGRQSTYNTRDCNSPYARCSTFQRTITTDASQKQFTDGRYRDPKSDYIRSHLQRNQEVMTQDIHSIQQDDTKYQGLKYSRQNVGNRYTNMKYSRQHDGNRYSNKKYYSPSRDGGERATKVNNLRHYNNNDLPRVQSYPVTTFHHRHEEYTQRYPKQYHSYDSHYNQHQSSVSNALEEKQIKHISGQYQSQTTPHIQNFKQYPAHNSPLHHPFANSFQQNQQKYDTSGRYQHSYANSFGQHSTHDFPYSYHSASSQVIHNNQNSYQHYGNYQNPKQTHTQYYSPVYSFNQRETQYPRFDYSQGPEIIIMNPYSPIQTTAQGAEQNGYHRQRVEQNGYHRQRVEQNGYHRKRTEQNDYHRQNFDQAQRYTQIATPSFTYAQRPVENGHSDYQQTELLPNTHLGNSYAQHETYTQGEFSKQ